MEQDKRETYMTRIRPDGTLDNDSKILVDPKRVHADGNSNLIVTVEGFSRYKTELSQKVREITSFFDESSNKKKRDILRKYFEIVNLNGTLGICDPDEAIKKIDNDGG